MYFNVEHFNSTTEFTWQRHILPLTAATLLGCVDEASAIAFK